jgi:hypothetical protein
MAILDTDGNANDKSAGSSQFSRYVRRHRSHEAAIGKTPRADLNGFEQSGESAAGANRFDQRTLPENHGIAGSQVGRDHCQRDLHILELLGLENPFDEIGQAMIAGESEAETLSERYR